MRWFSMILIISALAITAWSFVMRDGAARTSHCGCAAGKGSCEEPCSFCCGSGGYEACRKNTPDPTAKASHGCCASGR